MFYRITTNDVVTDSVDGLNQFTQIMQLQVHNKFINQYTSNIIAGVKQVYKQMYTQAYTNKCTQDNVYSIIHNTVQYIE